MTENDASSTIRAAGKHHAVIVRHEISERLLIRNVDVSATHHSKRAYGGTFVNITRVAGVRAGIANFIRPIPSDKYKRVVTFTGNLEIDIYEILARCHTERQCRKHQQHAEFD